MPARSEFETPLQKVLELVLVWILPRVGSIIVIAVPRGARSDYNPRFESDSASDVGLPGTGPMLESFGGHHGGHGEVGGEAGYGGDVGGGGLDGVFSCWRLLTIDPSDSGARFRLATEGSR